MANLLIFVVSIVTLGFADFLRRRGDSFFQEASNQFQELEAYPVPGSLPEEVATKARLSLRSFTSAADLPLVRGRYGVGIYAAVNIIVVLIAVIIYSQAA